MRKWLAQRSKGKPRPPYPPVSAESLALGVALTAANWGPGIFSDRARSRIICQLLLSFASRSLFLRTGENAIRRAIVMRLCRQGVGAAGWQSA
jgi:hypothetical protein